MWVGAGDAAACRSRYRIALALFALVSGCWLKYRFRIHSVVGGSQLQRGWLSLSRWTQREQLAQFIHFKWQKISKSSSLTREERCALALEFIQLFTHFLLAYLFQIWSKPGQHEGTAMIYRGNIYYEWWTFYLVLSIHQCGHILTVIQK